MSDSNLVNCGEDHEMITILRHYGKRTTQANIDKLRRFCKSFKDNDSLKPHNRANFYQYLVNYGLLTQLE